MLQSIFKKIFVIKNPKLLKCHILVWEKLLNFSPDFCKPKQRTESFVMIAISCTKMLAVNIECKFLS